MTLGSVDVKHRPKSIRTSWLVLFLINMFDVVEVTMNNSIVVQFRVLLHGKGPLWGCECGHKLGRNKWSDCTQILRHPHCHPDYRRMENIPISKTYETSFCLSFNVSSFDKVFTTFFPLFHLVFPPINNPRSTCDCALCVS